MTADDKAAARADSRRRNDANLFYKMTAVQRVEMRNKVAAKTQHRRWLIAIELYLIIRLIEAPYMFAF